MRAHLESNAFRSIVICTLAMLVYMAASRFVVHLDATFPQKEIIRTPLRLILLLIFLKFGGAVRGQRRSRSLSNRDVTIVLLSNFVFLASQILCANFPSSFQDATILALTAVPVGLVEEFFFRGILLIVFVRLAGMAWGLFLSAVAFVLFHYGVIGTSWIGPANQGLSAIFLGIVMLYTGRLWVPILLHIALDVVASYSPIYREILFPIQWVVVPQLIGIFIISAYVIATRGRRGGGGMNSTN